VHYVDPDRFAASFRTLREFDPTLILSTHLPPITGDAVVMFDTLLEAPQAEPFVGPDQAALEAMLAQFQPA
jgi:hypothetical protein